MLLFGKGRAYGGFRAAFAYGRCGIADDDQVELLAISSTRSGPEYTLFHASDPGRRFSLDAS